LFLQEQIKDIIIIKAQCGAAAPCRRAATVRQLPTRGEWWEADDCVELTERVQLQWHCEDVDETHPRIHILAMPLQLTRSVCSTQSAASHHSTRVGNCLTVASLWHGVAAAYLAFMGIK